MSPASRASMSNFKFPPSPSRPTSGANIRPSSLREMLSASPLAFRVIASRSVRALSLTAATFVFRVALSIASNFPPSHSKGRRKFSGTPITSARGIETTPEALRVPESSVRAESLASILPEALTPKSGATFSSSSRDRAVSDKLAFSGAITPENLPVPFWPMNRSDEIISRGEKFTRALAFRGNVSSLETIFESSAKAPSGLRVIASSERAAYGVEKFTSLMFRLNGRRLSVEVCTFSSSGFSSSEFSSSVEVK